MSLDQATAAHDAGTSPRLDVLRAQVDYQNEQQTLISATNQLAKDKLALARAIGLPLDQQFRLTDTEPYAALDNLDPQAAFAAGAEEAQRPGGARMNSRRPPRRRRRPRSTDQLPTAKFAGDFGDLGETRRPLAWHLHGDGDRVAPILQIAKTKGEEEVAEAQ